MIGDADHAKEDESMRYRLCFVIFENKIVEQLSSEHGRSWLRNQHWLRISKLQSRRGLHVILPHRQQLGLSIPQSAAVKAAEDVGEDQEPLPE